MGYIIQVDDKTAWAGARWVYEEILRAVEPHLELAASSPLRRALADPRLAGERVLRLQDLPVDDVRALLKAARAALTDGERAGSTSFSSPEFYPGFLERLQVLIDLLAAHVEKARAGDGE